MTEVGSADLSTSMAGSTSAMSICALSLTSTDVPSLSSPVTVTVSATVSPPSPLTGRPNEQAYVPPGAMVCGTEQEPRPSRSMLPGSSTSAVSVIGSRLVLVMTRR